ncbi:MAG: hypothetical protein ACLFTK_02785 [Anaerolineales bacterium]
MHETTSATPRVKLPGKFIALLLVASLAGLFLPLYLLSNSLTADYTVQEAELGALETQLAQPTAPEPTRQAAEAALSALRRDLAAVENQVAGLQAEQIDWPGAFAVLADYDTNTLQLTDVTHYGGHLILEGRARNETDVRTYSARLEDWPGFRRIIIQSLQVINQPSTGRPTVTPADYSALATQDARHIRFAILAEFEGEHDESG